MSVSILWALLACLVGALILQGIWLRARQRRALIVLRYKHDLIMAILHGDYEQMRLRMLQLQRDQAVVNQSTESTESSVQKANRLAALAREALESQLDADTNEFHASPVDGFEDTQIQAHEAQHSSLLLQ